MMRVLWFVFVAAAVLTSVSAFPAQAQNATTVGALDVYATHQNIGVRLSYSGDANLNATARVDWKPAGDATWRTGMSLTRISNSRWAGSVMWLTPASAYDVRVVVSDADGGGTATGVATTRDRLSASPSGTTYWVATNGNDGNPGSSTSPFATIQAALAVAQAGAQVRVRPGVYYQTFDTPRSGTLAAPIHLVADGPGVVLDGSDPAYLNRSDWRDDGGGIWSVPFTGTTRIVVADSSMRLYKQGTLSNLQANANGMTQGWASDGSRLYVKLEGAVSPLGRPMHVARYDAGALIDVAYFRMVGFEIRNYGTTAGAAGISLRSATSCEAIGNSIWNIGGKGIFLRVGAATNLVEYNVCRDTRIFGWNWNATKGHEEELQGISGRGGRGNVIRYNTVRGTFDGIDSSGDPADENASADEDIHDNRVISVADDALETEDMSAINVRVYRNWVEDPLNCMSIAPNWQGPEYIVFNTFHNFRKGGFKLSINSIGQTYIFHNTISSPRGGTGPVYPTGTWSNKHFRNNVMVGNGQPSIGDDAGESQTGNDFDGDLLHVVNYGSLVVWKGVAYSTLSAFRSATGFEAVGRSGDPMFTSGAAGDYTLRAGSPAIDTAIRLFGINDVYGGAGPDMGAWEIGGATIDVTPPAAIQDLTTN